MKKNELRSSCPINYTLENLGDKWSLLILRDMIFDGKRFYKDFLASDERIATNILSDRLKRLENFGFIKSKVYEKQRTQKVYSLTTKSIDLVPLLLEMIIWATSQKDGLNVAPEFLQTLNSNKIETTQEIMQSIKNRDLS